MSQPNGHDGDKDVVEMKDDLAPNSPKKQKLTSPVWLDFKKFKGSEGQDVAKCNHCKKVFVGVSSKGINHLKNHLSRCLAKTNRDIAQQMLSLTKNPSNSATKVQTHKFSKRKVGWILQE
ncbi:hypothetical protein L1049_000072 [Liquidambar formosana]|uniref:BED-type domain-containing protein n=1 Tax=Liquidambar formosana TaxID=63359 RepID=A0AAP0NC37_LIQFO